MLLELSSGIQRRIWAGCAQIQGRATHLMKNHNLKRRLFHAVGATSLGPVLTAVIQLVSVPMFLHFWGAKLYGEWLVLSAIPIYLGFTDFGFGNVAGSEMTMLVARGAKDAALEVFQSTWLLTTVVSSILRPLCRGRAWGLTD